MAGCNNGGMLDSSLSVADEQSVKDLSYLMSKHPELSSASLKEIKNAASGVKDASGVFDLNYAAKNDQGENTLNREVAKKAQDLIDKILEEYNLKAQFNSDIKIMGIFINMQRETMEQIEKELNEANEKMPSDLKGATSFKSDNGKVSMPTCEEIIENPFGNMPAEEIEKMFNLAHEQLKSTISGCAKIQGQPFVKCMEYFNKMTALVNKHASCNMQSFEELAKIAENEFNMSFYEIKSQSNDCLKKQFSQCGYEMKKVEQSSSAPIDKLRLLSSDKNHF